MRCVIAWLAASWCKTCFVILHTCATQWNTSNDDFTQHVCRQIVNCNNFTEASSVSWTVDYELLQSLLNERLSCCGVCVCVSLWRIIDWEKRWFASKRVTYYITPAMLGHETPALLQRVGEGLETCQRFIHTQTRIRKRLRQLSCSTLANYTEIDIYFLQLW